MNTTVGKEGWKDRGKGYLGSLGLTGKINEDSLKSSFTSKLLGTLQIPWPRGILSQ